MKQKTRRVLCNYKERTDGNEEDERHFTGSVAGPAHDRLRRGKLGRAGTGYRGRKFSRAQSESEVEEASRPEEEGESGGTEVQEAMEEDSEGGIEGAEALPGFPKRVWKAQFKGLVRMKISPS